VKPVVQADGEERKREGEGEIDDGGGGGRVVGGGLG